MLNKTDVQLRQEVLDELVADTRLDPTEVGVTVQGGALTLTGRVASWEKKLAAAEAAHRVAGVLDVANDVEVDLPGAPPSDTELAAAIRETLLRVVAIPSERILSTVMDGFVALEGEVEDYAHKDDAARAVRDLKGVVAVDNRIVVRRPTERGTNRAGG